MNRASDREARLVVIEERVHEVMQRLEELMADQERTAQAVTQLRASRDLTTDAILKLSRELGAQREKYPLE